MSRGPVVTPGTPVEGVVCLVTASWRVAGRVVRRYRCCRPSRALPPGSSDGQTMLAGAGWERGVPQQSP